MSLNSIFKKCKNTEVVESDLTPEVLSQLEKASSKNPDHLMLFDSGLKSLSSLTPATTKLFMVLAQITFEGHPNQTEHAYCICSLVFLVEQTGLTKPTVIKGIKELVSNGFIKIFKTGNSNVYAIDPNKCWKSAHNKKWKAVYYKKDLTGYIVRGNIILNSVQDNSDDFED